MANASAPPAARLAPAAPRPGRPRLIVVWRVTEACDLNCAYCEYRRGLRRPRRAAGAEAALTFGHLLAAYAAATGREVMISWLGGEPLLWPPLWEVSAVLRRECGLALSLTTNGTRLGAPGVVSRLVEDYAEVTLSLDGPAALHDQVRAAPGLHARLRAAVAALRRERERLGRGPLLRVNTVLMRSNLFGLEALGRELAAWGIDALTVNLLGGDPGDAFFERERLGPEHLAWLAAELPALRARLAARGLRLQGSDRYFHRLAHTVQGLPLPVDDCAPGDRLLFVDASGRAAPCAFTSAGYGVPITILRTAADIGALPARLAAARQRSRAAPCLDCHSTQVFGKFEVAHEP